MKLTGLFKRQPRTAEPKVEIRQRDYLKLFQLMRDHRLLQIRLMGDDKFYQTMLLEVNSSEGYLLIDEPFPHEGLLSGHIQQDVVVEYESEGFCTRFATVVEGAMNEDGDRYFRLAWPEKVEELQRRDQYRVDVTQSWEGDIRVSGIANQNVSAVLDISATGIRLAFKGNQIETIHAGTYFNDLILELDGCEPIRCNLDITHCHYVPDPGLGSVQMTVAGGRLEGLNDNERQLLQRFVLSAQRLKRREQLEQEVLAA